MADAELRGSARIEGAQKAADDLKKIADAQDNVTTRQGEATGALDKATEASANATASTEDYTASLSQLNPTLGAVADGMRRGVKIADDLAKKKLSLKGITKSVTGVFTKFGGAIKLLGAAGIAYAGSKALVDAINEQREATELAEQAMAKLIERQTELLRLSKDIAQAISGSLDTKRSKTPNTAAQEASIAATLEAAPPGIRDILKPILEEFGGAKGFGAGAGQFTGGELENLARLGFKVEDGASQRASVYAGRRFLERRSGDVGILDQRFRDQRSATTQRAGEEAVAGGEVGTAALDSIIGPIAERLGVDPEMVRALALSELQREFKARRLARGLPEASRRKFFANRSAYPGQRVESPTVAIPFYEEDSSALGTPFVGQGDERRPSSPTEVAAVDEVMRRLLSVLDKMADQPSVVIKQYNGHYATISGDAERAVQMNGSSIRSDTE